jgi:NADP-dependent 3-hydroxy acid dehydrogenase YdfG
VLVARNTTELEAAAKEIKAINSDIQVLTESLDIRDKEAVKKLFAKVKAEVGTADVLINNAGVGNDPTSIRDMDSDDFWNTIVCQLLLQTRSHN